MQDRLSSRDLSEQITLFTIDINPNALGGYHEEWNYYKMCWAKVGWMGISGVVHQGLREDLSPLKSTHRYKFILRHQPSFPSPLRIVWRERTFGLMSDILPFGQHFSFFIAQSLPHHSTALERPML